MHWRGRPSTVKGLVLVAVLYQAASGSGAMQGAVVPMSLSRPVYPAIAVAAMISGDVEVSVRVRPDGRVDTATIVSGPPLLQQAALDAVQTSAFECRACGEASTPYSLVFAFRFDRGPHATVEDPPGTVADTPSQSRVTILAEAPVAIPYFSSTSARSVKCAYLWRCGSRWGGYNYYYYPVRAARCLWLWKCGSAERE
jgi:TonB family protein